MKRKAIVVDDELTLARLVAAFLKSMGWEVFEFSHPQDVVNVVNKINPKVDLLITDWAMPQMNGAELIKLVKEKKPHIKAICMSGLKRKEACIENGCNKFLFKPFSLDEFKLAIDALFPPRSR